MAITINGVLCQELVANFKEGYNLLGGPSATKGFLCDWGQRFLVASGLLGLQTSTRVGGLITLNTPLQYPELATMYAQSIDIIPVGNPTQNSPQLGWPFAIVYCNYGCLPWSFSGIDGNFSYQQIDPNTPLVYCKQNIQTSTRNMTIPSRNLKFATGNTLKDQSYQMPLFQAEILLTFMRIPYFPAQQIFTSGKSPMNSATFLGLSAGYVFFNGSTNEASRDTAGNLTMDLTLSFSYCNIPWDQAWDPDATPPQFSQVQVAGSSIIKSSDFNSLIPGGYLL